MAPKGNKITPIEANTLNSIFVSRICSVIKKKAPNVITVDSKYIKHFPSPPLLIMLVSLNAFNRPPTTSKPCSNTLLGAIQSPDGATPAAVNPAY